MNRRKFVVGLGSLAAGASVTMGTGALSATEADRQLTGKVADDSQAYVRLVPSWHNGQYVDDDGTEIALDFGKLDTSEGLNANATSWFDRVFKVQVPDDVVESGYEDYEVWFELNVSNHADRIDFYYQDTRHQSMVDNPTSLVGSADEGISGELRVGVMIDLQGVDLESGDTLEDFFGVTNGEDFFTVHVDNKA